MRDLIQIIENAQGGPFYHVTPTANVPAIQARGLVP